MLFHTIIYIFTKKKNMDFIDELKWRGMINDLTPGLKEYLSSGVCSAYVGFDPTASSLHIGNLAPVMLLTHFQNYGHKPILLLGGATAMIGDPSGKSTERQLLDADEINSNLLSIKKQLQKFLDFETKKNHAEFVNNLDWMQSMNFNSFLRNIGKYITINYMLSKDSVKNRMESGISFTEFSYQLVQAYDFLHLLNNNNCAVQIGGSDQWGNITTGIELIRKKENKNSYALTCPLLTKSDGTKFGKTEDGNVWLDPNRTSPYKFFQYWLNISDEDAKKCIRFFSVKQKDEILNIEDSHNNEPHLRILQNELAKEMTIRIHGKDLYEKALEGSKILFGSKTKEVLEKVSEKDFLMYFEGVPTYEISKEILYKDIDVLSLLTEKAPVFKSKGELRRMLQSNAISLNKEKIDLNKKINIKDLLNDKYLLFQRGKKNYFVIKIV